MHIQNFMKFCPFVQKILSENKILTSIKGHSSVINRQTLTHCNNPNLDLVNINAYIQNLVKFYQSYIEWKQNYDGRKE